MVKKNKWKQIWEQRSLNDLQINDSENTFMELKRCDGFDVLEDGLTYQSFYQQHTRMKKEIEYDIKTDYEFNSVFEVGCGCGANLYLFQQEGKICGGIDYSHSLIEIAKKVLGNSMLECTCDEAINLNTTVKYDVIISNSVFSYFMDYEYAWNVLEKMNDKCLRNIAVIDIFDKNKENEFYEYRRRMIPDYDNRYEGLDKLFYPKLFWLKFAEQSNMDIKFSQAGMDGYWNNDFVYSCYLYKRE